MNIDSKKIAACVMYAPFGLTLGGVTMYFSEKLAEFTEWQQFSIPADADYKSVVQAQLFSFCWFIGLLSIPRMLLYWKAATKQKWTFAMYWLLPFVLVFVLPEKTLTYALLAIAGFSWLEVLILFDPLESIMPPLPPKR